MAGVEVGRLGHASGTGSDGGPVRPGFNPQVAAVMEQVHLPSITAELIGNLRVQNAGDPDAITRTGVTRSDHTLPGHRGATIELTTWRRPRTRRNGPCYLFLHGGGLVSGDRWDCGDVLPELLADGGVLASVEYRLAPEHRAPTQVEDCYAALVWLAAHAEQIGFDPDRIIVAGTSAGAGLAAGVLLAARDRRGPRALGAWLNTPMLDDTTSSCSARQFMDEGLFWDGRSNITAWQAVLGERFGTPDVTCYEAPARAEWLGDLPPVLITVGSAEPFRDEAVGFASRLWRDGGDCELMVLPGGIHCFADAVPGSSIAVDQQQAVRSWIRARLEPDDPADAERDIARLKPDEQNFPR